MRADVEVQVRERFSAADEQWSVVMHKVHEASMECNRAINDALYEGGYRTKGSTERMWVNTPSIGQPKEGRDELRRAAYARIDAEVKAANLKLNRDEADLLRTLGIGAIESEEAREFLSKIPTVGELVSRARIAELEASLKDDPS